MNILAHLYLSYDHPPVMLGNFLADFLAAGTRRNLPAAVYRGVLLHREIDQFTDGHERFKNSKRLLWQRHRHYSSVIVDIFYDHFLAVHWHHYSATPLADFSRRAVSELAGHKRLLPERARRALHYLEANDVLVGYATLAGIERTMEGMARRASFPSNMAGAVEDLRRHYDLFGEDFRLFFPQLANHSLSCLRQQGCGRRRPAGISERSAGNRQGGPAGQG